MPNVMAALPNIGGALRSTPQSLTDPTTRVSYSNAVEEILLLNKLFSDCRYVPSLRRYGPTKLCDGAQMAIFGDFFGSCICSEPRAAHFRPAF